MVEEVTVMGAVAVTEVDPITIVILGAVEVENFEEVEEEEEEEVCSFFDDLWDCRIVTIWTTFQFRNLNIKLHNCINLSQYD
jgi:hypothetical protein